MRRTINDSTEPANPFGHRVLSQVAGDEDALDHQTDVIQFGLGRLPELLIAVAKE